MRIDQGEVLHGTPVSSRINSRAAEMQNINAQGTMSPRSEKAGQNVGLIEPHESSREVRVKRKQV